MRFNIRKGSKRTYQSSESLPSLSTVPSRNTCEKLWSFSIKSGWVSKTSIAIAHALFLAMWADLSSIPIMSMPKLSIRPICVVPCRSACPQMPPPFQIGQFGFVMANTSSFQDLTLSMPPAIIIVDCVTMCSKKGFMEYYTFACNLPASSCTNCFGWIIPREIFDVTSSMAIPFNATCNAFRTGFIIWSTTPKALSNPASTKTAPKTASTISDRHLGGSLWMKVEKLAMDSNGCYWFLPLTSYL